MVWRQTPQLLFYFVLHTFSFQFRLTSIHGFISSLHDGPVYAGHQPCSYDNAEQQPQDAVADPHHHIVEKEEVVEAVECLPVGEGGEVISRNCIIQIKLESYALFLLILEKLVLRGVPYYEVHSICLFQ